MQPSALQAVVQTEYNLQSAAQKWQKMVLEMQVNGVETITAKEGGRKYLVAWGWEAPPATLRQVVRVFIPAGREAEFKAGSKVKLSVAELDMRNGALSVRLANATQ